MKRWVLKTAWRTVYPVLRDWLNERALRLPASTKLRLAKRLGLEPDQIDAVEAALRVAVLDALDEWKP